MTEFWLQMDGWDQLERWQGPFRTAEEAEAEADRSGWRGGQGTAVYLVGREPDGQDVILKEIGNANDGLDAEDE